MWTYDPSILNGNTQEGRKNIVRLLVGDTDSVDPQLQDEEIYFALNASQDKVYPAASTVINVIISKYARLVNIELDEAIREDYSDLIDNYKQIRADLITKSRFMNKSIRLLATGLTKSDFETGYDDPNRIQPGINQSQWSDDYANSTTRYQNITV